MPMERKLVLITNDDGVDADGLKALTEAFSASHDIVISAPSSQRSAVSHSISVHCPVTITRAVRDNRLSVYAIDGTPADCVKLAVTTLMDRKPDIVVSGINAGANLGINAFYSGTLAGAVEGALMGIPAFAISLDITGSKDYAASSRIAGEFAEYVLQNFYCTPAAFNVNVPALGRTSIKGIRLTKQDPARFRDKYSLVDRDAMSYRISGEIMPECNSPYDPELLTDVQALKGGFVSVTPVCLNRTDFTALKLLTERGGNNGFFK
ncbi:MAG: 5'/3'-nucleotidase SurE [Planctomycetes bacterium]|nr:5'/3'-nucleotidase SurE [Planctomycetota bacterium]